MARVTMTGGPLSLRSDEEVRLKKKDHVHKLKEGFRCVTEKAGQASPGGLSPKELVLDASEGFIPLWAPAVILRWQFADGTLEQFNDPASAGAAIEDLIGEALVAWGDAAPVKFTKGTSAWDFEVLVRSSDDCDAIGCVLASAFFPDAGRHRLNIYPILFRQSREEQIETLCHEIGHAFGLRHFFAQISETGAASVLFGEQSKFTIMNYGSLSKLTPSDRSDLTNLYKLVWSGELTEIKGTPIRLVKPYHDLPAVPGPFAIAAAHA